LLALQTMPALHSESSQHALWATQAPPHALKPLAQPQTPAEQVALA
jgi:hypothetical protein